MENLNRETSGNHTKEPIETRELRSKIVTWVFCYMDVTSDWRREKKGPVNLKTDQ